MLGSPSAAAARRTLSTQAGANRQGSNLTTWRIATLTAAASAMPAKAARIAASMRSSPSCDRLRKSTVKSTRPGITLREFGLTST
ncbi:hypothetical protein D3C86_1790930 [compost metagenome]